MFWKNDSRSCETKRITLLGDSLRLRPNTPFSASLTTYKKILIQVRFVLAINFEGIKLVRIFKRHTFESPNKAKYGGYQRPTSPP